MCAFTWFQIRLDINIFSGVPQGTVLGPFLFIFYVNDMPNVVSNDLYMFADDTKLYRTITSESNCNKI